MSQNAHFSVPDDELAAALAKLPSPPPETEDVQLRRRVFDTMMLRLAEKNDKPRLPPEDRYRIEDHTISVEGGEVTVRCVIPTSSNAASDGPAAHPLMVWAHGGGGFSGTMLQDDYFLRRLAVEFEITIVNVEYRLAPEYPFPAGFNDCYTALKWAVENASTINASPKRGLIVGGASAGGNIAAALALRARDDSFFAQRNIRVTGQLLQFPKTVHIDADVEQYRSELLSWEQNKDAPFLSMSNLRFSAKLLKAPPSHPYHSVLLAPSHTGLAPAFLQICGLDPLRDEGILYEKVLSKDGVRTRMCVYSGLPHGGHAVFGDTAIAKRFESDFEDGLRWLLSGEMEE
ncbi:hypothetical protein K474DRAFT_1662085 [Panus rudis PR-1116 ss-1]|nr:hypothetical protein K474DRAFT_1662085 [Panus rudis PR-1116 ss-1]